MPEEQYITMLHSADATIVLTERENCLLCGAYESIAAGKPMILSGTNAIKGYLNCGAIYVNHTVEDMQTAMREVLSRKQELAVEVVQLKSLLDRRWLERKAALEQIFHEWL